MQNDGGEYGHELISPADSMPSPCHRSPGAQAKLRAGSLGPNFEASGVRFERGAPQSNAGPGEDVN
uniref:Uncharacterized protein n=1 Tax=Arundo donax TaxID=35708 RepID=A0A0A9EEC1_ARUDO